MGTGSFVGKSLRKTGKNRLKTAFVQAKPYYGGEWHTLDPDYRRIPSNRRNVRYNGHVSLDVEGKKPAGFSVKKSLDIPGKAFGS
jgi:hypothetical protein